MFQLPQISPIMSRIILFLIAGIVVILIVYFMYWSTRSETSFIYFLSDRLRNIKKVKEEDYLSWFVDFMDKYKFLNQNDVENEKFIEEHNMSFKDKENIKFLCYLGALIQDTYDDEEKSYTVDDMMDDELCIDDENMNWLTDISKFYVKIKNKYYSINYYYVDIIPIGVDIQLLDNKPNDFVEIC
jgi:hypothetical protein